MMSIVGDDVDVGVEHRQRLLRRIDLAVADPIDVVEDLTLEVGRIHLVHVDDPDRAHPSRRQIQRGR
jgi:hypothetical protein